MRGFELMRGFKLRLPVTTTCTMDSCDGHLRRSCLSKPGACQEEISGVLFETYRVAALLASPPSSASARERVSTTASSTGGGRPSHSETEQCECIRPKRSTCIVCCVVLSPLLSFVLMGGGFGIFPCHFTIFCVFWRFSIGCPSDTVVIVLINPQSTCWGSTWQITPV